MASSLGQGPFIDAATLRALMRTEPELVVPVDCRFNLLSPHTGFHAYLAGHLPSAVYAHLDRDLARRPASGEGRHPLPDPGAFARFLGAAGIGRGSMVVAYDDAGGAIAARLWWLLGEVGHRGRAILDGGLQAWLAAGNSTEQRLPARQACNYAPGISLNPPVLETRDVEAFLAAGGRLLDARSAARFAGREEPIDPIPGHVPGAANLPFNALLTDTGGLRSRDERTAILREAIAGCEGAGVAVMCGSGVTACLLAAAIEATGLAPPRLYAGSWSEWIRDSGRMVATGAPSY